MQTILKRAVLTTLVSTFTSLSASAWAEPADYVSTPIVEEGEREIDFKAGSSALRDGSTAQAHSLGLGWGAKRWWFTEFYAKWHKEPGSSQAFDAWEWENKFQLTETGQYPIDLGLLLEVERPQAREEGYEFRWGPLLQAELSPRIQTNLNLLIQKHVQTSEPAAAELGYQGQIKYRWRPALELGLQGFGTLGPWNRWDAGSEQSHTVGPAVFGRVSLGGRQVIQYNAALLWGMTQGSPLHTFRLQAEYEF